MTCYRIELRWLTPVITPLHSGTLFGHLCWAFLHCYGEQELNRWLNQLPQTPLLLSAGFPHGYLPLPLLPAAPAPLPGGSPAERRIAGEHRKRLKCFAWLPLDRFLAWRSRPQSPLLPHDPAQLPPAPSLPLPLRVAHNTINRLTGTTPPEGGLYFTEELWPQENVSDRWDVYACTSLSEQQLSALFAFTGYHGYGKDATLGRGRFTFSLSPAPPSLFDFPGNRLMSLSHGSLTSNMVQPRYRLATHYGKTGSWLAATQSPFKSPLLLLRPGATFTPRDSGPFGELLCGVHPHRPEILHNAWHLTVPYQELSAQR